MLTGSGPDSADTFRIQTCPRPLGVYRHDLTLTTSGPPGHTGSILGVPPDGSPSDTTLVQSSSAATMPPRFNRWFGFGRGEIVYYRVSGSVITTLPYVATHSVTSITPVLVSPPAQAGPITITTVGRTVVDTELFLFDQNFTLLRWNDDDPTSMTSLQSRIDVTLAPGTYYIAVSTFNTAIFQATGNTPPNPPENLDRSTVGPRLDFPDALVRTSLSGAAQDLDFGLIDATGSRNVTASVASSYDMYWARFIVNPPPPACCFADGSCLLQPPSVCAGLGGVSLGDGSSCGIAGCPDVEACCLDTTTCVVVSPLFCSGLSLGPGSVCGPGACEAPSPCCTASDCLLLTPTACMQTGGVQPPSESPCTPETCALRACCFEGGGCNELRGFECEVAGGVSGAIGQGCVPSPCVMPLTGCCFADGSCADLPMETCAVTGGQVQSQDCGQAFCPPADPCASVLAGDANCDGAVNNFDIDPFVQGVLQPPPPDATPAPLDYLLLGASQSCWELRRCWGDLNGDGKLNNFDIDPLVGCILSPPPMGVGCSEFIGACCVGSGCAELRAAGCLLISGHWIGGPCPAGCE